jgi:hypothetical protein
MFKVKAISAIVVTGIFGLAACGGGSGDKDDSTVTTVRQKNAALSFTTVPKTVTTPLPVLGGNTGPRPTTIAPIATTTTQVKTVTTPMPNLGGNNAPRPTTTVTSVVPGMSGTTVPCLPPKKRVGPFCK